MILVIDDNVIVHELLELLLPPQGYSLLSALSGPEGLALFQAHRAQIRLILLDLQMPLMGGVATLHQLRALGLCAPVIIFTAMEPDDAATLLPPEADMRILEKSCGRTVLLTTITNMLHADHHAVAVIDDGHASLQSQ